MVWWWWWWRWMNDQESGIRNPESNRVSGLSRSHILLAWWHWHCCFPYDIGTDAMPVLGRCLLLSACQVKGCCMKCSGKHRTIVAKTDDPNMVQWLTDLKDSNPVEYSKVLQAAEPKAGQKYSKFNLTAYHEQHVGRKVRGHKEEDEAMTWPRYCQYHMEEITDPNDRMTLQECRASWLRDLQGPDAEKRDFYCRKRQAWESRDVVWVNTGKPVRYKKKEEEEARMVQRTHQSQSGADSVAAAAFSRMQNFVSMSGQTRCQWIRHQNFRTKMTTIGQ